MSAPRPETRAARAAAAGYLPAMDGLRGVAALMVLALHFGAWTGTTHQALGQFAVALPVFFVLSGYLLYRPWAAAAIGGRPPPAARAYYWHRLLRIMPAYWAVALTVLLVTEAERLSEAARTLRILLLQHVFLADDLPQSPLAPWGGLSHTWSLATEVQFYLVLPLLVLPLRRASARVLLGACALLETVNLAWCATAVPSGAFGPDDQWRVFQLPGHLGYFAAGMAFAVLAVEAERTGVRPAAARLAWRFPWACWGIAVAVYALVASPLLLPDGHPGNAAEVLAEHLAHLVIAGALVAPVALTPASGPGRLLARSVPVFLGRISYGVFLWHMIVIELLVRWSGREAGIGGLPGFAVLLPLAVAVTVALAWLSYVLLERPTRRLRFRPAAPASERKKPVPVP